MDRGVCIYIGGKSQIRNPLTMVRKETHLDDFYKGINIVRVSRRRIP